MANGRGALAFDNDPVPVAVRLECLVDGEAQRRESFASDCYRTTKLHVPPADPLRVAAVEYGSARPKSYSTVA